MEQRQYNELMVNENVIEFLRNQETATLTLSQGSFISKVKKLAGKYPNECKIIAENKDGSILAHIPTKWIKINANKVTVSEEAKARGAQNLKAYRERKGIS